MKTENERKGGARLGQKFKPRKAYIEVECQWCGAVGRGNAMKRWHGENCKMKPKIEVINESNQRA